MAHCIKEIRGKEGLHEIERKTNQKLYVHCHTRPSGLKKRM
jgi:hypothetical protein